jgi:Flp pilus assembly protein TadD
MAQNATEAARVLADTAGQQEAMGLKGGAPEAPRRETTIGAEPAFQHTANKMAENAPTSAVRDAVGAGAKSELDLRVQGLNIQEAAKPAIEPEPKVMDKSVREEIKVSAAPARAAHRLAAKPVLSAPPMPAPAIELSMPSAVAPETPAMAPPPMSAEEASVAAGAPAPPPAPRAEARMAPAPSRAPALADGARALEKAGEAGSQAHIAMAGPAAKPQEAAGRYVARGDRLREQGELTRAIENYKSALDLEPKNVEILVKLGETLLQNGKKKEALRQLQQAVKVEPRNVAAQCGLARALESASRVDEAVEHLQKALEIDPSSAQAKEALERLKPAPKKP